jgi:hypothetical protein
MWAREPGCCRVPRNQNSLASGGHVPFLISAIKSAAGVAAGGVKHGPLLAPWLRGGRRQLRRTTVHLRPFDRRLRRRCGSLGRDRYLRHASRDRQEYFRPARHVFLPRKILIRIRQIACVALSLSLILRRVISVHILCVDDCLATTMITQLTEITKFIFGLLGRLSSVSLGTVRSNQFVLISAITGGLALRLRCI